MNELDLYKFIEEYSIELRWECYEKKEDELIAWIPYYCLEEFTELIGYEYLSEGGIEVNLQIDGIALNIAEICENFGIEAERIYKKEK